MDAGPRDAFRRAIAWLALPCALIAITSLSIATAGAQAPIGPPADRTGIASRVVTKAPAEIAAVWSARRMRRAEPLDLRRAPAGAPVREARLHAGHESLELSETTSYPNRVHGKVFFKIGASSYVCSGTVVPSASDDLLLTAGHCVYDAGGTEAYVTNLVFVPGYRNGTAPLGVWPAQVLSTTTQWRAGNWNYDLAFANLARVEGQTLEEAVGARGIAFNQPRAQSYEAFGYPAASPFDGRALRVCDSAYIGDDPFHSSPGPAPMGIACDMTGGSSGGGWVTAAGYVASVTSFGYAMASEANHLYGPYLGAVAKDLYAGVDGAPGTPADLVPAAEPAPADTTPPETTITAGPHHGGATADPTPTFAFAANEAGSRFECRVDEGAFAPCTSPRTLSALSDGVHSFAVRATDLAGNADPAPADRVFAVDTRIEAPTVSVRATQRLRGKPVVIELQAGAGEAVRGTARGRINVKGMKRSFRLRAASGSSPAGELATYRLQPARRADSRRISRLLRRGFKLRAQLKVSLADPVDNRITEAAATNLR